MKHPKVVLIDCDGVLTDGVLNIDHTGTKMFKSFHTRDVRAIRELVSTGYEVTIVTADDWPGVKEFAEKVRADVLVLRNKAEVPYRDFEFIAVGDDAWDVPMLRRAQFAYCPSNADLSVLQLPNIHIVPCEGGKGVIAHVLRELAALC